ncbi:hypothetical protein EYF80_053275 [Liparis tanakae]|uniref:Uncharacterized protein n=1 Tax=Liparis tanakae TaxID=230148 RepID=A0A4Z2F624_9TELE|nr:hypothetical protein EYF80_053275 [Liparis tanakae]
MICSDAEVWLERLGRPTLPMNSPRHPAYDLGLVNSARPHRGGRGLCDRGVSRCNGTFSIRLLGPRLDLSVSRRVSTCETRLSEVGRWAVEQLLGSPFLLNGARRSHNARFMRLFRNTSTQGRKTQMNHERLSSRERFT